MRGRLGIGTERILDHRHQRHVLIVLAFPSFNSSRRARAREARVGVRDAREPTRDARLESQRAGSGDRADASGERPERERRGREHEAADGRPDRPGEPPREGVDREVATAKVRRADVGDERLVGRAVEALADSEDRQATANRTKAAVASRRHPARSTSSQPTIQSSGISASARIRRRPSIEREIGSWASRSRSC